MDKRITHLTFHLERSQKAYELYREKKYFYQALRIYKANQEIYWMLMNSADLWNDAIKDIIIEYIFHLEDWFEQFERLRDKNEPALIDVFVFNRLEDSMPFPKEVICRIKNLSE